MNDVTSNISGLVTLMGYVKNSVEYRYGDETQLDVHPFDMPVRLGKRRFDSSVYLVGSPSQTDSSVGGLAVMIGTEISRACAADFQIQLRIFKVDVAHRNARQPGPAHDLYFEVVTDRGVYICGGCNNYSGTGGNGGDELHSIFKFLAHNFTVPITEVGIPANRGQKIHKQLLFAYEREQRRQQLSA